MSLTIVMYHYVRRLAHSRYPGIKGLEREQFVGQLAYLKRHYQPVTAQQVVEAARGDSKLPHRAVLLTFDDGYLDHFTVVFPILKKHGLHGCFFPSARAVQERVVLDVNKIHFILASTPDKALLVSRIHAAIQSARAEFALDTLDEYAARYATSNRFDSAQVNYIKRMLQVGLPSALRSHILDLLFSEFVFEDERAFANELYVDEGQLCCMLAAGMSVGSHGYDHCWLDAIDADTQQRELRLSLRFLNRIGVPAKDWLFCYPYGAWNESLLHILRRENCALAFTAKVGLADVGRCDPLLLPRLDANDLPTCASAAPVEWTLRATD
jgi:peptidoglycan/xylan/chitin deacetylase (PgdA/CDA1 family)